MSKTHHLQLTIALLAEEEREICIYALGEAGFESFEEQGNTLIAYIPSERWDEEKTKEMLENYLPETKISYATAIIPAQNWNELWERNYPNIYIDSFCQVIPSFRQPEEGFLHTLIIDPKMAFGTGHHSTTQLMILHLRDSVDCKDKIVLDMGCGTGILGILASRLGAKSVLGIDTDIWCTENTYENIAVNDIPNMRCVLGGAEAIPPEKFDIIIANINRNILLQDGSFYVSHLEKGGTLLLSGFYEADIPAVRAFYESNGMIYDNHKLRNDWAGICMRRV